MRSLPRRIASRLAPVSAPDWRREATTHSRFWRSLANQHREDLEQHGPDRLKRHQALTYFTWQWRPATMLRDKQVRFLLRHRPAIEWVRAIRHADVSDEAWADLDWSRSKRRAYTGLTRLLWDYALEHGSAAVLALPEPPQGAPLPVRWRGRLISQDLANTALEVRTMSRVLAQPRSFLEVGAGYGRTAYGLLSLYPDSRYTIIDIEPALGIARWYLSQLFDAERLTFLTPEEAGSIPNASVDLALSISTLAEMTPGTVAEYLRLFDRVAKHVYLKQWTTWRNEDDRLQLTMANYPYPSGWERVYWAPAPVQTHFTEGLWRVMTS
jgi:putative sugar O-methyltransferase